MVDATHKNGKIGDGGSYCCTSITWGLSEDLRGPPKFYGCIIMFPSTWLYIIRRFLPHFQTHMYFFETCPGSHGDLFRITWKTVSVEDQVYAQQLGDV
jgi:hypothetical protein